jgi:putative tricarboxylic transport membrane protein
VKANKGNLIAGACLAAFGIYVIFVASKLPYVSEVGPGPGFFPLWLGIGLIIFSSCLVLSSLSAFRKESPSDSPTWKATGRALAGWFGLMVAIALFGWIGFSASFVILTVFLIVALDRRPFLLSLGVGIGLAVAFHLLFVIALDVSLPAGRWGF